METMSRKRINQAGKGRIILLACLFLLLAAAAGAARAESPGEGKDHPCIHIVTEGGAPVLSRDTYVPAEVRVFNCDPAFELSAAAGVRVRGNSTADQGEEKPYRIRFEQKQNMLGLHDGRKYRNWVLLRTYWHLAPDYMAFRLAKTIFGGKYYSSDCMFVNLYLNEKPLGVYLLCEQNQAAKGRMDVSEPKEGETGTAVGYLVEMDNYPDGEHPYFDLHFKPAAEDITGKKRLIEEHPYAIKSDTRSPEQEAYIGTWVNTAFTILYEAAVNDKPMTFGEKNEAVSAEGVYADAFGAVDAVLDLESLADMLILEELVQNYDVGGGSFFMAVDFSAGSRYRKLTFLGPWDFSWGYAEPADGGYYAATFQKLVDGIDRSNAWFVLAMRMEGFREIVRRKWRELTENGALAACTEQALEKINSLAGDLGEGNRDKLEKGREIVAYVRARVQWLDSQWGGE